MLAQKFENYYGKGLTPSDENDWILDPFVGTDLPHLPLLCYGRVYGHDNRSNKSYFFCVFKRTIPKRFCKYPILGFHESIVSNSFEIVIRKLIPFATTWLCETAFSALCVLKTKHRNRLDVEADLWLCLSKVKLRFQKLANAKQAQLSH